MTADQRDALISGASAGSVAAGTSGSSLPSKQALNAAGLGWAASNPTIGTGVTYALQTSFSDTAALFALFNAEPAGGGDLYVDAISLWLKTAPTATVSMEMAVKVDPKDRSPTANNAAVTVVPSNQRSPAPFNLPKIQAFSGNTLTVPASGPAASTVARCRIPTGLGIVGDEYQFVVGAQSYAPMQGLTAARATAPSRSQGYLPPFSVPPQTWAVVYLWWLTAATTAPDFEYQISGYVW